MGWVVHGPRTLWVFSLLQPMACSLDLCKAPCSPWRNGEVTGRELDNLDSDTAPASCWLCVVNHVSLPQFPQMVIEKDEWDVFFQTHKDMGLRDYKSPNELLLAC